jgi:hypothetical protein
VRSKGVFVKTRIVAPLVLLALVVAGCSSSADKADQPAPTSTTTVTTTPDPEIRSDEAQVIVGSANGSSPCEKASPTPASPGQVGAGAGGSGDERDDDAQHEHDGDQGHGGRGMVHQKPLTQAQRLALATQMRQARAVVDEFPTVASALAGGYEKSTPYVPCIGAHYTNISLAGSFNPSTPSELLYDGTAPDAKLVGLSYLVHHRGGPPPGFAGGNDHWHQHNANGGLCLQGGEVVGGEDTSPQECEDRGGRKVVLVDIWMMHAWVVPGFECSWGVFSGECPELGGRLGGTAWEAPVPTQS